MGDHFLIYEFVIFGEFCMNGTVWEMMVSEVPCRDVNKSVI